MSRYLTKQWIALAFFTALTAVSLLPAARLMAAETVRYDEGKIKSFMQAYIEANMPWPKGTLRIIYPVPLNGVTIQGERITHEVVAKMNDGYIGDALFGLRFYDRGHLVHEEQVRLIMELARDVVVSDKILNKDRIIEADDVRIVRKWYRRISLNAVSCLEDAVGKRIVQSVRPNKELARHMLKEPIMVKRGKMVRIVLDTGPMQINATGLSEEDGMQGSIIRVRNMSSKRIIYARVLGESLVGVEF
jgi:flagella basal body P-ring formation protein FlgA